jgi:Glycine zipper 2TM domain
MKKCILAILLAAVAIPSAPAIARSDRDHSGSQRYEDHHVNSQQDRMHEKGHDNESRRDQAGENRRDRDRYSNNGRHLGQQKRAAWQDYNRYDYNRFDPLYGDYQANRYYRDGSYYQDRRLSNQDRIYRGSNGRYYCRRNDGTTGLIIGAVGGSLLGRAIAPNRSKTLGTILGGVGGALIGRSIGRDGVRCN